MEKPLIKKTDSVSPIMSHKLVQCHRYGCLLHTHTRLLC